MPRGKKRCLSCNSDNGVRASVCKECGVEFSIKESIKETKKVSPERQLRSLDVAVPAGVAPKKLSSKGHAKRILGYGKERASLLLQSSKMLKCWSHVDWSIVEKGLI